MKISLLSLLLVGAAISALGAQAVFADDATTNAPASGSAVGAGNAGNGQRGEKMREAFEQLNLTDAQRAQIKQIRASTPAGKERRQQIMAVLTPDQKAKLIAMLKEHRADAQGDNP
jgi:Spy/CpxP family protein refolding chaperone